MTASKKNKIHDLTEQIKKVDEMISFHADNPSTLMLDQYEYRKKQFINELIEELMDIKDLSKYNFKLIYLAINKYYPELIKPIKNKENGNAKINKQLKDLQELEAVLVA